MTPYTGELFLHEAHGADFDIGQMNPLKRIPLPDYMNPRHAVETRRGTFVVAHVGWLHDDEHDQVSEVNADGCVLRSYGGLRGRNHRHLNEPWYLIIDDIDEEDADRKENDGDGGWHVLVADRWNRRVVVLDSQLQLKRMLLTGRYDRLRRPPERMCYVAKSGRLLVGQCDHIREYRVK